jgi:hypothetical protein
VAIVVASGSHSPRIVTGRQRTDEALSCEDGPGRTSADPIRTNFYPRVRRHVVRLVTTGQSADGASGRSYDETLSSAVWTPRRNPSKADSKAEATI